MISVCVASGKGGAGKTSIAAAITQYLTGTESFAGAVVFADCDVDAANGAIALGARLQSTEPYSAGPGFVIDESVCSGCGRCATACRFDAITRVRPGRAFRIIPELCERCGACMDVCPAAAVGTFGKEAGTLSVSESRDGIPLVHAELEPGEDTSGKLVAVVRRRAEETATRIAATRPGRHPVIVIDGPPGIGCPVIASMTGTDLVLVTVESGVSGIRDARRLTEVVASMKRIAVAVINKTGLNPATDREARAMLAEAGIPIIGEIPFDPALRSVEEAGLTWASVQCESSPAIRASLAAVLGAIESIARKKG